MNEHPIEKLREMFEYAPELGGSCLRRIASRRSDRVGTMAGTASASRYWLVQIGTKMYKAHRIVWALVTGAWPAHRLDHKDGDTYNNAFGNLRECCNEMLDNMQNKKLYKNNRTGVQGVYAKTMRNGEIKYHAYVQTAGKNKHLGYFPTLDKAKAARLKAKAKMHTFNPQQK